MKKKIYPQSLILIADSEYGYHVYYRDYENEFSFFTDFEDLDFVIAHILEKIGKKEQ